MRRATNRFGRPIDVQLVFLSTLSLRRATVKVSRFRQRKIVFLSTLSLRRATISCAWSASKLGDFYPRSPCGERHFEPSTTRRLTNISIHALLAESDVHYDNYNLHCVEISIHALLAESDSKLAKTSWTENISIHALLAESDASNQPEQQEQHDFYPRSPCGERPRGRQTVILII